MTDVLDQLERDMRTEPVSQPVTGPQRDSGRRAPNRWLTVAMVIDIVALAAAALARGDQRESATTRRNPGQPPPGPQRRRSTTRACLR